LTKKRKRGIFKVMMYIGRDQMANKAFIEPNEVESVKSELKTLGVIGYDSYGLSSVDAVKSTISSLKEYDEIHPPQQEIERIRILALERRKG
jgi:hypothetical protein